MKRLQTSILLIIIMIFTSAAVLNATENDDAYGNSSDVFDSFIVTAEIIDESTQTDTTEQEIEVSYQNLLDQYSLESSRDPLESICAAYSELDREFLEEVSTWDDEKLTARLLEGVDENTILAILVTRSPKIQMAYNNWRASMERYPQTVFLQDLLAGYQSMTEGMSLGVGREYQRGMVQMHYPDGMLELRGRVVESDIDIAWHGMLKMYVDVISDAKIKLAEIRHKDEMVSINASSVSRLSVLSSVVQAQYVSGTRSFSDLVRIRTELASRQDRLNSVKSMRDSLTGQLMSMLDLPPSTQIGEISWMDDPVSEISIETLILELPDSNHELVSMGYGLYKMDAMIEMTVLRSDMDQTFGFTYYQGRDVESLEGDSGMDGGMSGMEMSMDDSEMDMDSMNFMNHPMVDYRAGNFATDMAWAAELVERRDAMVEMINAKTDMHLGMMNMQFEKYEQSVESAGTSRGRIIPNAQSALSVVRAGYTADENNFNDLIMAELALLMARMDLAGYELDKRVAYIEIERMLGRSLDADMESEQ